MYANAFVGGSWAYSLREHGADHALSEHFRLIEFACNDGSDLVVVHPVLVKLLEAIRERLGTPIHVNSAYRTWSHNVAIGGAQYSRHLYGMAADITARSTGPKHVAKAAQEVGAGGIGLYDSFTHVDVWKPRTWNG